MSKISKSVLKKAVKLSIAIHAYDAMHGFAPEDIGVSEENHEYMCEQAQKIAIKMAGNHPMNLGSVESCIEYFLTATDKTIER